MIFSNSFSVHFNPILSGTDPSSIRHPDSKAHQTLSLAARVQIRGVFIVTFQLRLFCFLCQDIFMAQRALCLFLPITQEGSRSQLMMEFLSFCHMGCVQSALSELLVEEIGTQHKDKQDRREQKKDAKLCHAAKTNYPHRIYCRADWVSNIKSANWIISSFVVLLFSACNC